MKTILLTFALVWIVACSDNHSVTYSGSGAGANFNAPNNTTGNPKTTTTTTTTVTNPPQTPQ